MYIFGRDAETLRLKARSLYKLNFSVGNIIYSLFGFHKFGRLVQCKIDSGISFIETFSRAPDGTMPLQDTCLHTVERNIDIYEIFLTFRRRCCTGYAKVF
jgi:hypothetical protein